MKNLHKGILIIAAVLIISYVGYSYYTLNKIKIISNPEGFFR